MPTAAQIATAWGLRNVDAIEAAAARTGLEFAVACALVQKESGGRNVFGADKGGLYKGEEVTEAKYKSMLTKVLAGATSNGVGLTQITFAGSLKNGRRDGGFFREAEDQGLKLWVPLDNCLFGFALLLRLYNANGKSWAKAGQRYNGAAVYGTDLVKKIGEWRKRLASADDEPAPADPEETPMARKTWRGRRFDARTVEMLEEVARRTKAYVRPTQGSYNTSVGASAGTHAGGGAVDISCQSLPEADALEIVRVMREVGFAAWMRKPSEGNWPEHIHGIAIGCPDLAGGAARQVTAYKAGLSGLASGKKDRHAGMGIKPTTWEAYKAKRDGKPVLPEFPGVGAFVIGKTNPAVTTLGKALKKLGFDEHHDGDGYQPGPRFTEHDRANLRDYQRARAALKGDADGIPGPLTWLTLMTEAAK